MKEKALLTVLVPVGNEEANIRECLETVKWADEIFIVDSFSTDNTLNICREYTDWIVQHQYINSATQKNWALPQVNTPWVLIIDADERVTPELKQEIIATINNPGEYDGFYIKRKNTFFGREMQGCGWQRDRVLRLFRPEKGRYQDRYVHADVILQGKTKELENFFIHNSYLSLEHYLLKFQRYTTWSSKDLEKKKVVVRWHHLTLRPLARFLRMFILHQGWKDGLHGVVLSMLGCFSVFMKYAKLWERKQARK